MRKLLIRTECRPFYRLRSGIFQGTQKPYWDKLHPTTTEVMLAIIIVSDSDVDGFCKQAIAKTNVEKACTPNYCLCDIWLSIKAGVHSNSEVGIVLRFRNMTVVRQAVFEHGFVRSNDRI